MHLQKKNVELGECEGKVEDSWKQIKKIFEKYWMRVENKGGGRSLMKERHMIRALTKESLQEHNARNCLNMEF